MLYTIVNFTTLCGGNPRTDIANLATLIHTQKLIHCVAIFTILYGNHYPPHGEFKLICIGKFARRTWVNFTQQYGKNRQRCQQNTYYYAVWQLLLYFYREFPLKNSLRAESKFVIRNSSYRAFYACISLSTTSIIPRQASAPEIFALCWKISTIADPVLSL